LKNKKGGLLGAFIKWNFTKFLIDKNGQPVTRYGPNVDPKVSIVELMIKKFDLSYPCHYAGI